MSAHVSPPQNPQPACESDPEPSSCPPPLGWKSVLANVREESQQWELAGRCGTVTGRTLGDGPPIYLLGSVGGTWELFALSMYLLRDEFRCVIIEYPGEQSGFTLDDFTADFFEIADEQGDANFPLFASSFGAIPAFAAMLAQPARISSAVIHAGFARRRLSLTERLLLGVGRCLPLSMEKTPGFDRVLEINHRSWFPPFDGSRWQFLRENVGAVGMRTVCRRIRAFQKNDLSRRLPSIQTPLHLLATEGEGVAIANERERLQKSLPHATTETLPHCGLLPYLTHPHLLTKALKRFLSGAGEC